MHTYISHAYNSWFIPHPCLHNAWVPEVYPYTHILHTRFQYLQTHLADSCTSHLLNVIYQIFEYDYYSVHVPVKRPLPGRCPCIYYILMYSYQLLYTHYILISTLAVLKLQKFEVLRPQLFRPTSHFMCLNPTNNNLYAIITIYLISTCSHACKWRSRYVYPRILW